MARARPTFSCVRRPNRRLPRAVESHLHVILSELILVRQGAGVGQHVAGERGAAFDDVGLALGHQLRLRVFHLFVEDFGAGRGGFVGIGGQRLHQLEFQLGGPADQVDGALGVFEAGKLDDDAAGALAADAGPR